MNLDRYTIKAQEAVQGAQTMAERSGHPELTTAHLLLALMVQEGGLVVPVLQKIGADPTQIKLQVVGLVEKLPTQRGGDVHISSDLRRALQAAEDEAARLKDDYVSTEHMLLALVQIKDDTARILKDAGAAREELLKAIQSLRGSARVT
ncbi:MAG: type VI secretion system ATPase TssH, partial [Planctomycetota bacterium]|nr:type VI secretion system ATPase TssH [Planctomycetota bacterium]